MNIAATLAYLDSLPLAQSLWWFIENRSDHEADQPEVTAVFFHLRSRYQREVQQTGAKA